MATVSVTDAGAVVQILFFGGFGGSRGLQGLGAAEQGEGEQDRER